MLSIEEFKKHLPEDCELTEEEIVKMKANMEGLAQLAFDDWVEQKKNKKTNSSLKN